MSDHPNSEWLPKYRFSPYDRGHQFIWMAIYPGITRNKTKENKKIPTKTRRNENKTYRLLKFDMAVSSVEQALHLLRQKRCSLPIWEFVCTLSAFLSFSCDIKERYCLVKYGLCSEVLLELLDIVIRDL